MHTSGEKNNKLGWIFWDIFLVIATVFFSWVYFDNQQKAKEQTAEKTAEIRQKGYTFINPLLECEIEGDASLKKYIPFERSLKERIRGEVIDQNKDAYLSFYFRNLNNGPWVGINEKEFFSPASLLKVPLMIAYFKEFENDPDLAQKELSLTKNQTTAYKQELAPKEKIEAGKKYTIEDLIERMIINSDNDAMDLLVNNLPSDKLSRIYTDLGVVEPGSEKIDNFMSVKEYASFFRILYNAAYLNNTYSEKALELLSKVDYMEGLVRGVENKYKVAHKFGERELEENKKQLHDCGIVYYSEYPYLICVMTRGNDYKKLSSIIATVSRITFEEIKKNHPEK